jgi:hypothetical protein
VGSDLSVRIGSIRWVSLRGPICAVPLASRLTTAWDGSLVDDATISALLAASIEH